MSPRTATPGPEARIGSRHGVEAGVRYLELEQALAWVQGVHILEGAVAGVEVQGIPAGVPPDTRRRQGPPGSRSLFHADEQHSAG